MLDGWDFFKYSVTSILWAKVEQQARIPLEQEAWLSFARNIVLTNVEVAFLAQ